VVFHFPRNAGVRRLFCVATLCSTSSAHYRP